MSLEDVIMHIRIEEQNKTRDKAKRAKELSSKANVVERYQGLNSIGLRDKTLGLSPTHQIMSKILPLKREVIALSVASLNTMYLNVIIERKLIRATQEKIW